MFEDENVWLSCDHSVRNEHWQRVSSHQELSAVGQLKDNRQLVCPHKIMPVKKRAEIFGWWNRSNLLPSSAAYSGTCFQEVRVQKESNMFTDRPVTEVYCHLLAWEQSSRTGKNAEEMVGLSLSRWGKNTCSLSDVIFYNLWAISDNLNDCYWNKHLTFNTVTFAFPITAWKPNLIWWSSGNKNSLKMITASYDYTIKEWIKDTHSGDCVSGGKAELP